jgi:hypothetical protein
MIKNFSLSSSLLLVGIFNFTLAQVKEMRPFWRKETLFLTAKVLLKLKQRLQVCPSFEENVALYSYFV